MLLGPRFEQSRADSSYTPLQQQIYLYFYFLLVKNIRLTFSQKFLSSFVLEVDLSDTI